MIKQSGILFTGKKTIKSLLLGSMLICSANADFLMTLTDKDGVEENICVKSYSFSNNLESLHKQQNQTKDAYSIKEILTNKTWKGKPVYRKIMEIPDFTVFYGPNGTSKSTSVISNNLETVTNIDFIATKNNKELISSFNTRYSIQNDGKTHYYGADFYYDTKKASIYIRNNYEDKTWNISNVNIIVEYTKTSNEILGSKNSLLTYVHYIPSNSTDNQLFSKSLNNTGVRFKSNYTYDVSTSSCIAPTN